MPADGEWSIGIWAGDSPFRLAPHPGVRNPVLTRHDIPDPAARFVADPFLLREGGRWHLFFEVLRRAGGGEEGSIGRAESADGLCWRYAGPALAEPGLHLSYPYVFTHRGRFYMIPETHQAAEIRLYEAARFPTGWRQVAVLAGREHGVSFVDPTLVRCGGLWWLFAAEPENTRLFAFSAAALCGPYTPHPANPVVVDKDRARCGGRAFVLDGRLYRLAQSCRGGYGNRVRAFAVRVTRDAYAEEEIAASPVVAAHGDGWARRGMHTVDPVRLPDGTWLAAVDGNGDGGGERNCQRPAGVSGRGPSQEGG